MNRTWGLLPSATAAAALVFAGFLSSARADDTLDATQRISQDFFTAPALIPARDISNNDLSGRAPATNKKDSQIPANSPCRQATWPDIPSNCLVDKNGTLSRAQVRQITVVRQTAPGVSEAVRLIEPVSGH